VGSAEAEGTPQDLAPWTSVRSDAFVVGKQDMSVTIALHAESGKGKGGEANLDL